MLRLCLLYHFGGLYTDISNTALTNFWEEIPETSEYVLVKERFPYKRGIHNAFIFARSPKSPLLQNAQGRALVRIKYPHWRAERLSPHYSTFRTLGMLYKHPADRACTTSG